MSLPTRPGFQKPTKSSSSSSASSSSASAAGGGVAPCARWNGNYSAGVSPVRGLSPVKGTFSSVMRQDIDMARSHTNPLFSTRTSDIGRANSTPTKFSKDSKENREKQEPWKVPSEKSQYGSKTLCTTPGKSSRTSATMRFTTPPKPVVKRKILAENREFGTGTPTRMKEEDTKQLAATSSTARREPLVAEPVAVSQSRNDESQCRAEDELSSLSPERSSAEPSKPKSPLVSIEELQKRIQKFLQDEGTTTSTTTADVSSSVTMSPRQSIESLRRSLSGALAGEESSSFTGLEEAPFQPMVAPYSPRPEFLRARKSPTPPVSMEGNVSPVRGEDSLIQENTTPTYDPKNNFLSPRPQFLRYRPLRRLELLRKSAEGTLADLDLESPATDAESPRMGSEKDDKEESELSQDVSQEIQSLKSSLESHSRRNVESELARNVSQELQWLKSSPESPPRCKVSSHELFKSADPVNEEIVRLNTEESEPSIYSVEPPPQAEDSAGVDVPCTRVEFQDLTEEGDQEELEEADPENNSSSVWCNACSILTLLALVSLVVVASGSTSLLPPSLHHNLISHVWKTSRTTEPIRQFLQTTEGLWAENPYLKDFSLSSPDILRVGWVHISSRLESVDLSDAVENGKVLWSSCMEYIARLTRQAKESFFKLKASLEEEMEFYSSHGQEEVNEWDWVPDYDFVVPHDMFDPAEAYANIMARVESWEVKSFWSSVIQSYAKYPSTELVQEEGTDQNLDGSRESRNSTMCSLPASPEDEVILSFRPASALGSGVIADVPVSPPGQDFERDSNVPEESEEGTDMNLSERNAVSGGILQESLVSVHDDDQELDVAAFQTEMSAPNVVNTVPENAVDAIVEVEPFSSTALGNAEDVQVVEPILSKDQDVEVVQLWHDPAEIHEGRIVEVLQVLDPNLSQDHPLLLQETLQGESSSDRQGMAVRMTSIPEENIVDSFISQETKPETPLSLILEKLMHAPSLQTTAAIATSLLLGVSVVALLFLHGINSRSENSRPANLKASSARETISKPSFEPQLKETEANRFHPVEDNAGDDLLIEDSSPVRLSSDYVKTFSILYPDKTGTPIRTLRKVMDMDKTPQKSFKHVADDAMVITPQKSLNRVADDEILQSPDTLSSGILEDSSLGRFVTLVPVVHNEGTARERVQLTPVRRSSRIRTKVQNSPCNLMHPQHLCNC